MTTDNKEAKINVAEDLYFYKGTTYNVVAGVQVPAVDVDLKKVGLTLTVTPHINTNKVVMMEITQKSESVVGSQDIPSSGSWPLTQISEMSASISVHSGETIVLGGLSKKEKSANKTKIPILGDIPLIRRLFGSVSDTSKRKERLVFITPYVLDTPEEIEASARRTQASLDDEGHWTRGWSASKLGDEPKDPIKEKAKKNTLFKLFKRKSSVSKSETDITKAAQAAASNAVPRPPETAAATNQPPAK
jgi:general secretion pathway protein D